MAKPYQLALTLHGHSADVRSLAAPNAKQPLLISASRDGSAIVWGPSSNGKDWDAKLRVEELERRFVNCATLVNYRGQPYVVIGSSSGMLASYPLPDLAAEPTTADVPTQQPVHTLIEHRQNLCCIDASAGGLIVTGSWDKTAIVWKDFKKAVEIKTHSQAVWGVKLVGEDRVLTASADKTITLHAIDVTNGTTTPLQTYTGHTDCVRGLSLRPDGSGFWSCGNDGLVNVYSFDKPEPVFSHSGHTSFVYSVTAFPDGSGAISSGEDGTLRVWSDTELVQSIPHPSMSLWTSAVVPAANGSHYIASGSADTTIRFFTQSDELVASAEDLATWDQEVSQRKLDKSQVGDIKRSDLPGMEALGRQGKKDGEVIMIKNGDNVEAYQWQASASTWQQVGQVVDAIGSGRKQLYEGKEYDYVFDVDVSEGMPPLKLPYNVTENPWVAAQRFLDRNELPSGYAEQVVDFIQKNTGGVQLGVGGGDSNYVDPFTGASRYTGGGVQPGGGVTGGDPLTGGSRYTGGGVQPGQSYGGGGDPFTGGGAYSTQPASITRILPVKTFLTFKAFNAKAAQGKVDQFKVEPSLALDDAASATLAEAFRIASSDKPPASENYDPAALIGLTLAWDNDHRFPLVDLLRALALVSPALGGYASAPQDLLKAAGWGSNWTGAKMQITNQSLALRALSNLFNTVNGKKTMAAAAERGLLVDLVKGRKWAEVGTAKQGIATIALNYSILAVNGSLPTTLAGALLGLITHILDNEKADSETIYRAAVALGNLLVSQAKGGLAVGEVQRAKQLVSARAGSLNEKRVTDLAAEISSLAA